MNQDEKERIEPIVSLNFGILCFINYQLWQLVLSSTKRHIYIQKLFSLTVTEG